MTLPGGHGTAQLVGLVWGVFGRHDRQFHHLFLKKGHAKGALEHRFQFFGRVIHPFFVVTSTQVGMHHVALDRSRADDGDLDDQVVEGLRAQAWQHGHLCT